MNYPVWPRHTKPIPVPPATDRAALIDAGQQALQVASARVHAIAPVQHVALRIDPSRLRRFHRELVLRLARTVGLRVTVIKSRALTPVSPSTVLLFALERMIYRISGPRLMDHIATIGDEFEQGCSSADTPDIVIDFCLHSGPADARTLSISYDGVADEAALLGAILLGRTPVVEIKKGQEVAVRANACHDDVRPVLLRCENVLARVIDAVALAMQGCASITSVRPSAFEPPTRLRMFTCEARNLADVIGHRLQALCCHAPHWRTYWRLLHGPDLWESRTTNGTQWNAIPDPGFRFYADPFAIVREGRNWVFVEDFDHSRGKACISVIPLDDKGPSGPAVPVLEESWHLSYPFVFEHDGKVWMIPESCANKTIALYRADPFPNRWVREAILLDNIEASDPTLVYHDGLFWMFATTRNDRGSWSDKLSIFFAQDFRGPWMPHEANPVLIDQACARPAGALLRRNGKLWRPAQDCTSGYGTGIAMTEVIRLDREHFEQRVDAVLRPLPDWPGPGLHTLNRAGNFEFVDGIGYSPRFRFLRKAARVRS